MATVSKTLRKSPAVHGDCAVEIDWNETRDCTYVKFCEPDNSREYTDKEGCETQYLVDELEISANRGIESGKLTSIFFGAFSAAVAKADDLKTRLRREISDRIALWRVLSTLQESPTKDQLGRRDLIPILRACEEAVPELSVSPQSVSDDEIGVLAGEIYHFVEGYGRIASIEQIEESLQRPHDSVVLSLGWLAREDKIVMSLSDGTITVECIEH